MTNHIKYRPDIDGLRALAVLSVIIFHFNNNWLPGGYLGVDVFFVISGFLITSIIKRQLDEDRFSFKVFYTRRIKRILPLLFTVLFITIIPAMYLLLPHDFDDFTRSVRYAMQFRANRAFTGNDYFDLSTDEKPLLHLWSLAIEEQFYFIWPLVVFIAYFFTKKQKKQSYTLFILALLGIILSTTLAEFSIRNNPGNSYYLLQNRAAELLVGCALALNPFTIPNQWKTPLGLIGFLVLVSCLVFYSPTTPMPGLYVLIPTIAAAFFILDTNLNSSYKLIFQNPIARTIGLWSFSLYLWHWPLLALPRYILQTSELPLPLILVAGIATFVLSIITYYLIENPIRKTRLKLFSSIIIIFLIPYGIVTTTYTLSQKYIASSFLHVDREKTRWFTDLEGCHNAILNDCSVGNKNAKTRYLLVGDSHAMHLSGMMDEIGKKEDIKIDIIAPPGCQILLADTPTKQEFINCSNANTYVFENAQNYDAVLLTQFFYPVMYHETAKLPQYIEKLEETLKFIGKTTPIIIIADVPALGFTPLRSDRAAKLGIADAQAISEEKITNNILANAKIKELTEKLPNTTYVDILPELYSLLDQNEFIYRDENHLNPYGSRKLGQLFIQKRTLSVDKNKLNH